MTFTEEQINVCKDLFREEEAKSLGQFPSSFGIVSGQDEIVRVFRLPVSEDIELAISFLRTFVSTKAVPDDFGELPAEVLTVTDPMVDGQIQEGLFRGVSVKKYRQFDQKSGTEYFYIVQILRKGYVTTVMSYNEFSSTSVISNPSMDALSFVDSGDTLNGEKIHEDTTNTYAKWFDGTNWVADIGRRQE